MTNPSSRRGAFAIAICAVATVSANAFAVDSGALLKKWDPDRDGTLDLVEVKTAASARFGHLDRDHDGTLDAKELAGVGITKAELAKADPDHDKTLDKDEYMAIVETRFKHADPDDDGTLDADELQTKAGKALVSLI